MKTLTPQLEQCPALAPPCPRRRAQVWHPHPTQPLQLTTITSNVKNPVSRQRRTVQSCSHFAAGSSELCVGGWAAPASCSRRVRGVWYHGQYWSSLLFDLFSALNRIDVQSELSIQKSKLSPATAGTCHLVKTVVLVGGVWAHWIFSDFFSSELFRKDVGSVFRRLDTVSACVKWMVKIQTGTNW